MGIGLIIFAISGGFVAMGAFPAVFGMTVGAIYMLVGLITMLTSLGLPDTPSDSTTVPDSASARP